MAIQRSGRIRVVAEARTPQLVPSGVLGMLIFVFTEPMLFGGLISAFTIIRVRRRSCGRRPVSRGFPFEQTAFNTLLLLASGAMLLLTRRVFQRDRARARVPMAIAIGLGAAFVALQGAEWVGAAATGADAHVEQPRLVLLSDHRTARAARGDRARGPRLRVAAPPARLARVESARDGGGLLVFRRRASGRCSTWWSTVTARIRRWLPRSRAAIVVATPRLAAACAVCMRWRRRRTQRAFAIGSLFLSVLPLAVVGGAVLYLRRRARAIESEANARRIATPSRARQSIIFVAVISSPTPAPPIVPARIRRRADQSSPSSAKPSARTQQRAADQDRGDHRMALNGALQHR